MIHSIFPCHTYIYKFFVGRYSTICAYVPSLMRGLLGAESLSVRLRLRPARPPPPSPCRWRWASPAERAAAWQKKGGGVRRSVDEVRRAESHSTGVSLCSYVYIYIFIHIAKCIVRIYTLCAYTYAYTYTCMCKGTCINMCVYMYVILHAFWWPYRSLGFGMCAVYIPRVWW